MRFSIIIPVYKVEKYLKDCVNSILSQSFEDFEIILVDDGSPDLCPKLCDNLASRYSQIVVIHKENGGLSSARNAGINVAKGDYIIFLDSDDCWVDTNALKEINQALNNNTNVLVWKYMNIPEDYTYIPVSRNSYNETRICKVNDELIDEIKKVNIFGCAWNLAIKRDLFNKHNLLFENGYVSEDIEWYVRLLMAIDNISITDLVVNGYRKRIGSISNSVSKKTIDDLRHHYYNIISHIKTVAFSKRNVLKVYLAEQIANYCIALSLFNPDDPKEFLPNNLKLFLKYCKRCRSRMIYYSISIFGVKITLIILRMIKKFL